MQKTSIGARFIAASKSCSTKPLSDLISKIFKIILNYLESFDKFAPWGIFGLGGISISWDEKVRQEKLSQLMKSLNCNKSSCITFCTKLF